MSLDHLALLWIPDYNQLSAVHLNGSQDLNLASTLVTHLLTQDQLLWYSIRGWVMCRHNIMWCLMTFSLLFHLQRKAKSHLIGLIWLRNHVKKSLMSTMSLLRHGYFPILNQEISLCLREISMHPMIQILEHTQRKQRPIMESNLRARPAFWKKLIDSFKAWIMSQTLFCILSLQVTKAQIEDSLVVPRLINLETSGQWQSPRIAAMINRANHNGLKIAVYTTSPMQLPSRRITPSKPKLSFLSVFNSVGALWTFAPQNHHSNEQFSFVAQISNGFE
jgi:hypothetical protein